MTPLLDEECAATDVGAVEQAFPALFSGRAGADSSGRLRVVVSEVNGVGLRIDPGSAAPAGVLDSTCVLRVRLENSSGFTPLQGGATIMAATRGHP